MAFSRIESSLTQVAGHRSKPRLFFLFLALVLLALPHCAPQGGRALPPPAAFKAAPTHIEGQVLLAAAEIPVAGARIATSPGTAMAVADGSGRFALVSDAFQTGQSYLLQVTFPGYAPLELNLDALEMGRLNRLPPLYLEPAGDQAIPEPPDLSDIPEEPTVRPPALED